MRLISLLFVSAVCFSCAATSFTQTSTSASGPGAPAVATSEAAAPLTFEVSTVKLNKSGNSGFDSEFHDGLFTATNVRLKNLIQYEAYGIPLQRIVGGPKWIDSARFDIEAKLDGPSVDRWHALRGEQRKTVSQGMYQALLADRFKLAAHWETRELPVYALVLTKNGSVLQKTTSTDGGADISSANGHFVAKGIAMPELCSAMSQDLARDLGRVVIDKTGLDGRYDVEFRWTPAADGVSPNNDTGGPASSADSGLSIFTAIQEQLGLKFESTKGPMQVLVIDHAEMPSEN
ncbi:MAG TPA: TIGR03435 family protein [Terracidiphilus sp.]|jgi:uncharacterized protein (TIGR03435 family)